MRAIEIQEHLRQLNGGWLDLNNTVDTFKAGDPDAPVAGIAVGWMSYVWALEEAVRLNCNVFVTHEPTYYDHHDNCPVMLSRPSVLAKLQRIEEHGLVIIRCHDLWDQMPGIGIPTSWGEYLGFGDPISGAGYFRVYDVSGRTAGDVAQHIAKRTAALGQDAVQLIGPGSRQVSRVAIGTGAITPFFSMVEDHHADLVICTDDGFTYWRDGAFAIDNDIPVIVVNHAVSEEAGMANLATHLQEVFPETPVHHIRQECMYRLVGALET
ncbi:MAG: Nif3-like dinuclear metal center hexameric protein [Anaerolineae bacterium]|nr:Nif3-like dinuclear metal center hexameric protein [Anaerolineae bacterium]